MTKPKKKPWKRPKDNGAWPCVILALLIATSAYAEQKTFGNHEVENAITVGGLTTTNAGRVAQTTRVTTTYTALATDHIIFGDTDGGAFTITLPAGVEGTHYKIVNVGTSGNDLTIDGDSAEEIYGELTPALSDGEVIDIHFNSTEGWW